MRVVCISDTHGLHDTLDELPMGDVLIHAGDFTDTGARQEVIAFNEYLAKQPHTYKIVIAGNHESTFDTAFYPSNWGNYGHQYQYDSNEVRALLTNALYLQDEAVEILGYTFYGSPWQPEFCNWAFNLPRGSALQNVWKKVPSGIDVLITHTPPYGYGDIVGSYPRMPKHVGCEDLRNEIKTRIKPQVHVFGHVHEGYGLDQDGTTTYINASLCTEKYKCINAPVVVDLAPRVPEKNIAFKSSTPIPRYDTLLHKWLKHCAAQKPWHPPSSPTSVDELMDGGMRRSRSSSSLSSAMKEYRVQGTTAGLLFDSTLKVRPIHHDSVNPRVLRYLFHNGFDVKRIVGENDIDAAFNARLEMKKEDFDISDDYVIRHCTTHITRRHSCKKTETNYTASNDEMADRKALIRRVTVGVLQDHQHTNPYSSNRPVIEKRVRPKRSKTLQKRAGVAILKTLDEDKSTYNGNASSSTEVEAEKPAETTPDCILCKCKVSGHIHPGTEKQKENCQNTIQKTDNGTISDHTEKEENKEANRHQTHKRLSTWF